MLKSTFHHDILFFLFFYSAFHTVVFHIVILHTVVYYIAPFRVVIFRTATFRIAILHDMADPLAIFLLRSYLVCEYSPSDTALPYASSSPELQ